MVQNIVIKGPSHLVKSAITRVKKEEENTYTGARRAYSLPPQGYKDEYKQIPLSHILVCNKIYSLIRKDKIYEKASDHSGLCLWKT